jgi:hypothetical protein
MLPAIAEVISVTDDGLPRLEHVAQVHLARSTATSAEVPRAAMCGIDRQRRPRER